MAQEFVPFSEYDWTSEFTGWLPWNPIAYCLIASFCAVAYWMCIELLILVYVTFKRHSGLYFWSIVITTIGVILQTTGYILKEFENKVPLVIVSIICKIGWISNVTGFAVVLWSRLHLVVNSHSTLRTLLIMIIANGIICHTPKVVFEFGSISGKHAIFEKPSHIMEYIQQTVFSLQEMLLSSLYIYHTARFLNIGYPMHTRKVIGLLLCVQLLVVSLDVMLCTIDYIELFILKCMIHPLVYAIKLKLEFIVLNQLQALVRRGATPGLGLNSQFPDSENNSADAINSPQFVATKCIAPARPVLNQSFITKANAASKVSCTESPSESAISSLEQELGGIGSAKHGSSQSLGDDEFDLKNIVGRPDSLPNDVDAIERMYLGRWDAMDKAEKGTEK